MEMNNKFKVGDLVKFTNLPWEVSLGQIGIVIKKSNRSLEPEKFAASQWAYKVKFIDCEPRWEMEYSLEVCGRSNG